MSDVIRLSIKHFNPRSPHGERPLKVLLYTCKEEDFNPRSPHGERPKNTVCDLWVYYFNPRSPHGERLFW